MGRCLEGDEESMHSPIKNRYGIERNVKRWLVPICVLLALAAFSSFAGISASFASHTIRRAAYTVRGTVYNDYNENGVQDGREPGINGVTVTAYDSANNAVATATSATTKGKSGQYTLIIPDGTGPVRVEFTGFGPGASPPLDEYQPTTGHDAAGKPSDTTTVRFIDGKKTSYTLDQGLLIPHEYCQDNPDLVTSCYLKGNQGDPSVANDPAVVKWPYDRDKTTPPPDAVSKAQEVGTTWGLAYRRSSDALFAGAYIKRYAGLAPGGSPGTIFLISGASTNATTTSKFVTLPAGSDPHDQTNNYETDISAYDAVGKIGLGGLDISGDEQTLFAMNLFDKKLYSIPLGAPPAAPKAGTLLGAAVPTPSGCAHDDVRPFAVHWHRGKVYVGVVCSAQSTQQTSDLRAFVYTFTPGSGFSLPPVFQMSLQYPRGCAGGRNKICPQAVGAAWRPWRSTFVEPPSPYVTLSYPQPMLTGLAFDRGDMILGFRDRFGDQTKLDELGAGTNTTRKYNPFPAGDTLRACLKTPGDPAVGWNLERDASCGGITTAGAGNHQGPDGGEYYFEDGFINPFTTFFHDDISLGSVLQIPAKDNVAATVYDPGRNAYTAGVRMWKNDSGEIDHYYQVYPSTTTLFGKSNGLGDLVALCQSAPLDIGNRVWIDTNNNGIQDPDEPAVPGVLVNLLDANGKKIASTTTDAQGAYNFKIDPYKAYKVVIDASNFAAGGPLHGYTLTRANADTQHHLADSKGLLLSPAQQPGSGNEPFATVTAHQPGQNDHTFDFGFTNTPTTPTPTPEATLPVATPTLIKETTTAIPSETMIPPPPTIIIRNEPRTPTPTPPIVTTPEATLPVATPTLIRETAMPIPSETMIPPPPIIITPIEPTPVPTVTETPTAISLPTPPLPTVTPLPRTVQFWLQKMDSCREALPGAMFEISGNGIHWIVGPTPGEGPQTVASGDPCPLQHGNCVTISTGCLAIDFAVPVVGTETYTITEIKSPHGYVSCVVSDIRCRKRPAVVTLTIDATGQMYARTREAGAHGASLTFPVNRSSFGGTRTDPVLIYNYRIGKNQGRHRPDVERRHGATIVLLPVALAALNDNPVADVIAQAALLR